MSTTIKSHYDQAMTIGGIDGQKVLVSVNVVHGCLYKMDDLFAAVAKECNVRIVPADAIVIERGELPEVRVVDGDMWAGIGNQAETRDFECDTKNLRKRALALLALAEYADNPTIDTAQVEAIGAAFARVKGAHGGCPDGWDDGWVALRLYLAGVRIEAAK